MSVQQQQQMNKWNRTNWKSLGPIAIKEPSFSVGWKTDADIHSQPLDWDPGILLKKDCMSHGGGGVKSS